MANLVAIAYDDLDQAKQVMGTVGELVKEHSLTLDDAVIVEHPGQRQDEAPPAPHWRAWARPAARSGAG